MAQLRGAHCLSSLSAGAPGRYQGARARATEVHDSPQSLVSGRVPLLPVTPRACDAQDELLGLPRRSRHAPPRAHIQHAKPHSSTVSAPTTRPRAPHSAPSLTLSREGSSPGSGSHISLFAEGSGASANTPSSLRVVQCSSTSSSDASHPLHHTSNSQDHSPEDPSLIPSTPALESRESQQQSGLASPLIQGMLANSPGPSQAQVQEGRTSALRPPSPHSVETWWADWCGPHTHERASFPWTWTKALESWMMSMLRCLLLGLAAAVTVMALSLVPTRTGSQTAHAAASAASSSSSPAAAEAGEKSSAAASTEPASTRLTSTQPASTKPASALSQTPSRVPRTTKGGADYDADDDVSFEEAQAALAKAMARRGQQPAKITVPLKVVALQGGVPARWKKDFIATQSSRVKATFDTRESFQDILQELRGALTPPPKKGQKQQQQKVGVKDATPPATGGQKQQQQQQQQQDKGSSKSSSKKRKVPAVAADLVSLGDRWLKAAVQQGLIEPIPRAESSVWYQSLQNEQLKALLKRNKNGDIDPVNGQVYAAPYRLGCLMVAWRADKFKTNGLPPIEAWSDLWNPKLRGRVGMVAGTREAVALAQRAAGVPFNVASLDSPQAPGTKENVERTLSLLTPQLLVRDSGEYLKALQTGGAWVAVGWSSDILTFVKRNNNICTCVPKDGTILFADLWAIPATRKLKTVEFGGRIRGPSPVVAPFMEFCAQPAREPPLTRDAFPAFSPASLGPSTELEAGPTLRLNSSAKKWKNPASKGTVSAAQGTVSAAEGTVSAAQGEPFAEKGENASKEGKDAAASGEQQLPFTAKSVEQLVEEQHFPAGSEFLEPMSEELVGEYNQAIGAAAAAASGQGSGPVDGHQGVGGLAAMALKRCQLWWISKQLLWSS